MANCVKCNLEIPKQRLDAVPGTKVCVNCSSEKAKGAVDIIYHKTGNTIQIMDKEAADSINKAARRTGFGSLRAMRGGSGGSTGKVELGARGTLPRVPTQQDFEQVGQEMMSLLELGEPREASLRLLHTKREQRVITNIQYQRLLAILDQFAPEAKLVNPRESSDPVSDEINWAFKNWRNSKIYR